MYYLLRVICFGPKRSLSISRPTAGSHECGVCCLRHLSIKTKTTLNILLSFNRHFLLKIQRNAWTCKNWSFDFSHLHCRWSPWQPTCCHDAGRCPDYSLRRWPHWSKHRRRSIQDIGAGPRSARGAVEGQCPGSAETGASGPEGGCQGPASGCPTAWHPGNAGGSSSVSLRLEFGLVYWIFLSRYVSD